MSGLSKLNGTATSGLSDRRAVPTRARHDGGGRETPDQSDRYFNTPTDEFFGRYDGRDLKLGGLVGTVRGPNSLLKPYGFDLLTRSPRPMVPIEMSVRGLRSLAAKLLGSHFAERFVPHQHVPLQLMPSKSLGGPKTRRMMEGVEKCRGKYGVRLPDAERNLLLRPEGLTLGNWTLQFNPATERFKLFSSTGADRLSFRLACEFGAYFLRSDAAVVDLDDGEKDFRYSVDFLPTRPLTAWVGNDLGPSEPSELGLLSPADSVLPDRTLNERGFVTALRELMRASQGVTPPDGEDGPRTALFTVLNAAVPELIRQYERRGIPGQSLEEFYAGHFAAAKRKSDEEISAARAAARTDVEQLFAEKLTRVTGSEAEIASARAALKVEEDRLLEAMLKLDERERELTRREGLVTSKLADLGAEVLRLGGVPATSAPANGGATDRRTQPKRRVTREYQAACEVIRHWNRSDIKATDKEGALTVLRDHGVEVPKQIVPTSHWPKGLMWRPPEFPPTA